MKKVFYLILMFNYLFFAQIDENDTLSFKGNLSLTGFFNREMLRPSYSERLRMHNLSPGKKEFLEIRTHMYIRNLGMKKLTKIS